MAQPAAAIGVFRLAPADALVLRLAFAASFGFAIAVALEWEFSFLAPMLAVQIIAALPGRPTAGQSLAIPLTIFIGTDAALFLTSLLIEAPAVLLALVGLVICLAFYAQRRGGPTVVAMLIQIAFFGVLLTSTMSLDLAHTFADFLQCGAVAAIVTVWLSHLLFPAPSAMPLPPAPPPGLPAAQAARVAISDTIVLLPLLVAFVLGGDVNNFVILVSTINLVRELRPLGGAQQARGLLIGNVLGGAVAVVAQQVIILADNFVQFLLIVFLAGLVFGARMVRARATAPIFALALATFILLIGIAISPLPGGSEESYVLRVLKIAAASIYALGALSLVAHLRRDP